MEILEINGPTTPANRGPPAYTELATAADYDAWNGAAAASGQKVVGVFRKLNSKAELSGKFFNAFKAASKVVAKGGGAAGIITHSVFDGKSGKYQPEAIIEEFAASDKYVSVPVCACQCPFMSVPVCLCASVPLCLCAWCLSACVNTVCE